MKDQEKTKGSVREIHLKQMVAALINKSWLIALTGILCAVLSLLGSVYLITPQYESSVMFYVNNSTLSLSNVGSISAGDLSAAQDLVNSYIVILESREALLDVIDYSGVDRSVGELRSMISAASVNGTEIFEVVVKSPDPVEAAKVANAIRKLLPTRIKTIIDGTSAKVVDSPIVADSPSSPSYLLNTVIGLLVGLVGCTAAVALSAFFDVTVRSEDDVQAVCRYPILASVPDMTVQSKGAYYYSSSNKKRNPANASDKETEFVGSDISFAAAEAYKLLRTKLQFSFADGRACHVIGVSSAMAGEGKSLSSSNLACALSQLDQRVLLVDCDMRRPSLNTKLNIKKVPGLSNYLTRQVQLEDVVQHYASGECRFSVIAAGRNPPNPIELLSSTGMKEALEQFSKHYDYIILDLPPVGEVSDALVAATLVDGILLVVRQNYCNSHSLRSSVEQFDFVGGKVLGVVLNCAAESNSRYSHRYKGYRSRRSGYESSYLHAAKKAAEHEGKR